VTAGRAGYVLQRSNCLRNSMASRFHLTNRSIQAMLYDPRASGTGIEPDVETSRALMPAPPLLMFPRSGVWSSEGMARVFFLPVVLGRLKITMTFELQTELALPQASCLHNHHQPTLTTTQRRAFKLWAMTLSSSIHKCKFYLPLVPAHREMMNTYWSCPMAIASEDLTIIIYTENSDIS
jgi:hypothetical protein